MLNNLMFGENMTEFYTIADVADMLGVSKETLRRWDKNGKLTSIRHPINNYRIYSKESLSQFEQIAFIFDKSPRKQVMPNQRYTNIELFAGAGGLALGLERAGLYATLLNEIDKHACETLKNNRPSWNVVCGDVSEIDFSKYHGNIDVVTGGFPCQAFSYAGNKLGFEDTRGTLFYEFARAVKESQPKIFVAENVRGLLSHNEGNTLRDMTRIFEMELGDVGYTVLEPKLLKAIFYKVPQKRERLFIVGIRNDLVGLADFDWPKPHCKTYKLSDALKKGELFNVDVPASAGQTYPERKKEILSLVPQGGYWRDLPLELQKEYMLKSFFLGGGKTGMARRMSWDEPCLTLTCSPAQKQTERCHPDETRPFTVREYARIQTFPDTWEFSGSVSSQYKQIGNAVPVNLAYEIGISIVAFLNELLLHKDGDFTLNKQLAKRTEGQLLLDF